MARVRTSTMTGLHRLDAPLSLSRTSAQARAGLAVDWLRAEGFADGGIDGWSELASNALEPNVFLEPAFARAAAARFGGKDFGAVVVRTGERLVGFLPGHVETIAAGRPVPTFVAWTHPFAPFSLPLVDRDRADEAVAAMLEFLPVLPGRPRLALFPLLAEEGEVAQFLAAQCRRAGKAPYCLNPHRRAMLQPGEEDISAKKRKELNRQRRRLAETGTLEHRTVNSPHEIREALAAYFALESSGWKGRAGGAAVLDAATARFMNEAVSALASEGKARIDLLTFNGRAIAATITLFSGDRAWFWKTAYDETFARFSPGVQLALDLTEAMQNDTRIACVDSCAVADHPMIGRLWSGRLAVADWLVPLGGSLSFAAGIAVEHARRGLVGMLKAVRGRVRT